MANRNAFQTSIVHDSCLSTGVYLDFYHLKQPPFELTPNPRFLFQSKKHSEAFNHLLYGIQERKGFVQLTGEVGAGKTTICRAVLRQLDIDFTTATILNPLLNADELMKAIGTEFRLDVKNLDRHGTIAAINDFLLDQAAQCRDVVLIMDEAQDLTDELLELVRLLSNLELDNRKLLQIILMGQPELRSRLDSPRLRQLRQRITVRFHLEALNRAEVAQYVQYRLAQAGANGEPRFTGPALWRVFGYSRGIPRLINSLCDKALLAGYVKQTKRITYRLVGRAIRELEGHIEN